MMQLTGGCMGKVGSGVAAGHMALVPLERKCFIAEIGSLIDEIGLALLKKKLNSIRGNPSIR